MSIPISEMRELPADAAFKLREHGIGDVEQFLAACRTSEGRREIARSLGIKMSVLAELEMSAFLELARQSARVVKD
jgi:hypothetical protein